MSFKLKSSNTLKNLRDMTLLLLAKHSLQLHSDRNNNNNIIYLKRIDRVVDIFSSVCTAKQLRFESLPPHCEHFICALRCMHRSLHFTLLSQSSLRNEFAYTQMEEKWKINFFYFFLNNISFTCFDLFGFTHSFSRSLPFNLLAHPSNRLCCCCGRLLLMQIVIKSFHMNSYL